MADFLLNRGLFWARGSGHGLSHIRSYSTLSRSSDGRQRRYGQLHLDSKVSKQYNFGLLFSTI